MKRNLNDLVLLHVLIAVRLVRTLREMVYAHGAHVRAG